MFKFLKKYIFESNSLILNMTFIVLYIAAFVIALKWNNSFHSYWGFVYLFIALAVLRELYKMMLGKIK